MVEIPQEYAFRLEAQEQEAEEIEGLEIKVGGYAKVAPIQAVKAVAAPKGIEHLRIPPCP